MGQEARNDDNNNNNDVGNNHPLFIRGERLGRAPSLRSHSRALLSFLRPFGADLCVERFKLVGFQVEILAGHALYFVELPKLNEGEREKDRR